jgi:undecaprenyl-diphosphatase
MGYRRSDIAMYSFLLAVPTILAASFFDLLKSPSSVVFSNIGLSVLGFVTAFISALVVVKWLIKYLQNNTLVGFGLYRIVLGLLLLVLLFI